MGQFVLHEAQVTTQWEKNAMFGEGKGCLKVCSYISAVFSRHTSTALKLFTVTRYTGRVKHTTSFDNTHRTLYVGTYTIRFVDNAQSTNSYITK